MDHAIAPPSDPPNGASPLLITVEEAARRLGVGRTIAYGLVAAGHLESVKIGRLRRVPVDALGRFVASLTAGDLESARLQPHRVARR
jgi:excisionase family DNA binding protein